MDEINKIISDLKYPPTMHYYFSKDKNIIPTGYLALRINNFIENSSNFFVKNNDFTFLDIGCSKGFFSLFGNITCNFKTTSIDVDKIL